ncbi:MAG: hypothetical protein AB1806_18995 [Acidobacteriota bacterium]
MIAKHRLFVVAAAIAMGAPLSRVVPAQEAVDQKAVAQQLLSTEVEDRFRALAQARALGPSRIGPELRDALIAALEVENRRTKSRHEAALRGEYLEDRDEFYPEVAEVVVALRTARAIPALAGALGHGMMVIRALVDFGESAVPAVLTVVTSEDSLVPAVDDGLHTLQLVVEGSETRPLSPATRRVIVAAARQRLSGSQFDTVLCNASDLAVALNDRGLREIVQRLAEDGNEVVSRGVTDPSLVEHVQRRAAAALAKAAARR